MGKINVLPENVRSKIAAGEVVERPSSVLKELLENSIDAEAKRIFVEIEKAGKKLIKVVDNGTGIEEDDIEKVFSRYATSKIKDEKDLDNIVSLGFRGEALYSIGVVSDAVLRSKTEGSETGAEIHIRGGKQLGKKKVSMNKGTIVEVRELFFNTPARKKFLKSDTTEFRQILNIFTPYAVLFNNIEFKLKHNKREIFNLSVVKDIKERIKDVCNINIEDLIFSEKEYDDFAFTFYLGNINIQRPRRDLQFLYVNNRPVYSSQILSAVNRTYRTILPNGVYPAFFIMIRIKPDMVDVNIHPAKREIKIKDEDRIIKVLTEEIYNILLEKGKGRKIEKKVVYIDREKIFEGEKTKEEVRKEIKEESTVFDFKFEKEIVEKHNETLKDKLKEIVFVGIFSNKYIFFEGKEELFIFDQHATHERINYEKFLKQIKNKELDIQKLLTPLIMKLTKEEMAFYEEIKDKIEKTGFQTTRWSEDEIAIHGYPALLKDPEFALRSVLSEIDTPEIDEEKIARSACRSSVMTGDRLSEEEAVSLIKQLLKCENPFVCPHGRPTVIEFSLSFFDRQFLR